MADEPAEAFALPVVWVDNEEKPVVLANQFLLQAVTAEEFVMSIGQVSPPAVIGSPDDQRKQLEQIPFAPVRTVARISFTRQRLDELAELLQRARGRANDPGVEPASEQP
jgi:hypothetical protein